MKILFLDIDGVLVSESSVRYFAWKNSVLKNSPDPFREWCPIATNNLRCFLNENPDVFVVLSSCWRVGRTVDECKELFAVNNLDSVRLIDRTRSTRADHTEYGARGEEIQDWLTANSQILDFVIVDDEGDMLHLLPKLIKIDNNVGLTLYDLDRIKRQLGLN